MARKPVELQIDDGGEAAEPSDERTIADALVAIAVKHCCDRDPKVRPQHVKAKLLHELHEGQIVGKAFAAAPAGEPDYDRSGQTQPPLDRYGDWERAFFTWGVDFYRRLARARGWSLPPPLVQHRAVAFGSAMASLTRYLEHGVMFAGQQERPPYLGGYGVRDPLLDEPTSGRPKEEQ